MSKKIPLPIFIAVTIVVITVTFVITMQFFMSKYNSIINNLSDRSGMYSEITELDEIVRKEFYGNIDSKNLKSNIAEGYVKGLNDEYSFYMTADEYVNYFNREKGIMSGIGISYTLNEDTGNIHITDVLPNSPAETGGLKKDDEIVKINDEGVTKDNYSTIVKNLEGEKMTSVNITYKRDKKETTISVVRGYNVATVAYRTVGSVGIVTISAFYDNTVTQFENAMEALQKQKVKSLIFDVRNCSKGNISNAASIIDQLAPLATDNTKAIATAVDQKGKNIEIFSANAESVNLPMVVLTNEKTAGAAELFACDLRDFGKAQLVGTKTKGKGTMQKVYQLDDGSAVVLTIAKILPYKSDCYNGVGVKPDYEVKLTKEQSNSIGIMGDDKDPQIQKAFKLLPEQ